MFWSRRECAERSSWVQFDCTRICELGVVTSSPAVAFPGWAVVSGDACPLAIAGIASDTVALVDVALSSAHRLLL